MNDETRDPKQVRWEAYWSTVGNETWLVARQLIELSTSVRAHFAAHVVDGELDWSAAAAAADQWPASTTERYLLDLVLALVNPDESYDTEVRHDEDGYYDVQVTKGTRSFDVRNLDRFGSWQDAIARILYEWMTR